MPGTPTKVTAQLAASMLDEHEREGLSYSQLATKYDVSKSLVGKHVVRARARRDEHRAERAEVEALKREARAAERRAAPPEPTGREAELRAAVKSTTPGTPEHTEARLWLRRYLDGRPRTVPLPSETGQPVEGRASFGHRPKALWENPYS